MTNGTSKLNAHTEPWVIDPGLIFDNWEVAVGHSGRRHDSSSGLLEGCVLYGKCDTETYGAKVPIG